MGRQWTTQQHNAIYATDGSVLVSAAAGSGKTAVLVERVINLITREENPIDVDRLLIVTFTRAAAAEMRQRLSAALTALLDDDPYNPLLLKQRQLLYNASISTIDSFCGDVVREYFHSLDVARDFRIADEGELEVLRSQALDLSFESFYQDGSKDFISLVNAFSSKGGDVKLRETVLKISEFLSTQPFPEKWLDDMLQNYSEMPVAQTIWGKIIIDYSQSAISHAINLTENSIKLLLQDDKLYTAFIERFEDDLAFLTTLQKHILGNSWDAIVSHIQSFSAGVLRAPKGYKENPIKMAVADNRDEVKATIKSLQTYFNWTEQEAREEITELSALVTTLFELIKAYLAELSALKAKKNVLSFSDIELLTVKLLAKPSGDGYAKTPQALEISARYDMVMVDEFQDVNDVQDLIFKCVSTDESNLFVVGDVKQSIYGFRQAKPEIFINRKNSYQKYDSTNPQYPATIILDKNFRSRKEVCNAVNFIFSRLMTRQAAQMDYTSDEKLNVGASYPDSTSCDFEIALIEKASFEDYDSAEVEARYIAQKIRQMMGEGFLVKDGDTQRKATYGDFAVIMRSPKSKAKVYVKSLIDCGIPAYSENKENSFDAQEIKVILNLLRIIDNPTLDIPLLSVMCSPIYGFNPDELSELRASSRNTSLFAAVTKYAEQNPKAAQFVSELNMLRTYSYTCSVDELIGKIYETTAFLAITAAVKGGTTPTTNLNMLREYARTYETNGYKTLSDFISFIDKLIENGTELPAASSQSNEINGVRVLSIHASKGLEYPVCFIADAAHKFNKADLNADVLVDSKAGLGIKKKDGVCRYNTLPRLAVAIEISQNEIAEELRVLYVALTRAKEKLIIVSSQKDTDKYLASLYSKIVFDTIIEPYSVIKCKSISDWIILSALVHPSLNDIRHSLDVSSKYLNFDDDTLEWKLDIIKDKDRIFYTQDDELQIAEQIFKDAQIANSSVDYSELLKRNLAFEYKNAKILNLPQKVSASQITHDKSDYFEKVLAKPKFITDDVTSAVERGTAHHRFLQFCDFKSSRADLKAEIDRLLSTNALTQAQAESIDVPKLSNLLNLDLFDRIINSQQIYREEQFFAKINPSLVYDEFTDIKSDTSIIVQGAIDLAFVENGELVIVDYKTDRVRDITRLADLYAKQLLLYKEAMSQTTGLKVKECIICSVHLDKYISLNY
jgi:ATP-dependent helicase/nuclease subunit A